MFKKRFNMKGMILILIIFIVVLNGCKVSDSKADITLSELQIDACNAADNAGTCDSRLVDLGIVLQEDCCQSLGKCCSWGN